MKIAKYFVAMFICSFMISGFNAQAQSKKEEKGKKEELKQLELQIAKDHDLRDKEYAHILKESKILEEEQLKALFEEQKGIQENAFKDYKKTIGGWMKYAEDDSVKILAFPPLPEYHFGDWPRQFYERFPKISGSSLFRTSVTQESTSMNIRKSIEDLSFDTRFKYNVQEGSRVFNFSAQGSVKSGTILIRLLNPDNKVIHEFEISPLADVEWTQTLRWNEEDTKSNSGNWTIVVSAKQATGRYSVSVRAN